MNYGKGRIDYEYVHVLIGIEFRGVDVIDRGVFGGSDASGVRRDGRVWRVETG